MSRPLFVPNPTFEHDLRNSDGVRNMLESLAYLEAEAQSRTRRRRNYLSKGIEYEVGIDDTHDGYIGRLRGTDFKTGWYEFGSARTPKDAMLRSTVEDNIGPVTGGDK